ncbi:MAG TPA: hypothetical protein VM118_00950 [Acidobacteriota bacterium]|nr:hypothetical protein [Acidobacteriota bacterium]
MSLAKWWHVLRWPVPSVVAVLILGFTVGCSGSSNTRRGSLSDAMDEASDENNDKYPKADTESDDRDDTDDEERPLIESIPLTVSADYWTPDTTSEADAELEEFRAEHFGFAFGAGPLRGDDFYGFRHGMFTVGGFISERVKLEARAAGVNVPIQKTSYLSKSLEDGVALLQLGAAVKFFTTPQHTFMGQYFVAGLNWTYMGWDYKNPISVGDETIETDWLKGLDLYVGLGWNLIQADPFRLGLEATPGLIFWTGTTSEGFDNDVFDTFYYVRFGVTAQLGF